MKRVGGDERPHGNPGPDHFTMPATTQRLLDQADGLAVRLYRVTFREGARTNWHRHDGEQLLFGVSGRCTVVDRDGNALGLDPGDLVIVDPGEEHWHGAADGSEGAHLAINLGENTTWLEPA